MRRGPAGPRAGAPASDAGRVSAALGVLFGLTGAGSSAAAVVLPSLRRDLGADAATAAWVLTGFVLMLAVTTALYGRLADLLGVRRPLVAGVVLMAVGAAVAATAPALPVLLAGRVVQGAGAGAVAVLSTALISQRDAGADRTAALARLAGLAAAGGALGPLAGGLLDPVGGWRLVLALPVLGLLLLPLAVPAAARRGTGGSLDVVGAALTTGAATGVVLLLQAPAVGAGPAVVSLVLLGLCAPALVLHVRRRPQGFLPRAVVADPVVRRATLAAATVPATWFALLFAVPAELASRGWTPLQVGLLLVPAAVTGALAPRLSRSLLDRLGAARALAVSAALSAASLLLAALGVAAGPPWLLALSVVANSVAFGLGQPALIAAVGDAVPAEVRGVALGAATLVFLVGAGVGVAAVVGLGALVGAATALAVGAVLPCAAVALAWRAGGPAPAPQAVGS